MSRLARICALLVSWALAAAWPAVAQGSEPEPAGAVDLTKLLDEPAAWRRVAMRVVDKLVDFVPAILAAAIILLVFFLLHRVAARLLAGVLRRTRADAGLQGVSLRLARYALLGLGLLMAANQLGFEVGSLLAGLGIVGLALGFAAQDTLANLIAGFTILWDRPFRTGDMVTVAGTTGQVVEIGLRSTRIRTFERRDAILPNREVVNQLIVNHTLTPESRLRVPVGISYAEDPRRARGVLLAVAKAHPLVAAEPAPEVVVTELAPSSVNLELRAWLADAHREAEVRAELLEQVKLALDEAGIEIPFPQRTVHVVNVAPPPGGDTPPGG